MNDELMRRISDALDAPGGLDANGELRKQLEGNEAASAYAGDLEAIDSALSDLGGAAEAGEPDWDAMLGNLEARLDEELEDIGDVTAPPVLDDGFAEPPVEVVVAAEAEPAPPAAKVVDLAERRARRRGLFATLGGLAAAAAVGLGIMAGLQINSDEASPASAPVAMEQGEAASATEAMADMEMEGDPSAGALAPQDRSAMGALMPAPEPASPQAMAPAEESMQEMEPSADMAPARRQRGGRRASRGVVTASPAVAYESLGRSGGGGGGGSAGLGATGGGRSETRSEPSRAEVVNVLDSAESEIRGCMGETRRVASVVVVVSASGRVQSASVGAPYEGEPAGACMVRVIRRLRMPRSASPTYTVRHTYRPERMAGGNMGQPSNAARTRHRRRRTSTGASREQAVDSVGF